MNNDDSVTLWIERLQDGDEAAAQELWNRYFSQLVRLAAAKLPRTVRRDFDEEDVALSAFDTLCRGLRQGKIPRLDDRNNLWLLLVVITSRKAAYRMRGATAQKRGGGRVLGESAYGCGDDSLPRGIEQTLGREPTADFTAEVADELDRLLALLPDNNMRELALAKLEGCTNAEAAAQLDCGLRTVERRLQLIRRIWEELGA